MPTLENPSITIDTLKADAELAKFVQTHLIRLGLLDPVADGQFGAYSAQALEEFLALIQQPELNEQTKKVLAEINAVVPLKLRDDFAGKIIRYMQQKEYFISIGKQKYNIVYVEGVNEDGTLNSDRFNEWNDRRIVIEIVDGVPKILGNWVATTEPGDHYTYNPMNPQGAARIAFGQYKAWQVGTHGESEPHEALVQARKVKVYRDLNQDGFRTGDAIDSGDYFGINQHYGYDMAVVGSASAGCLVGQSRDSHQAFMQIIKQDQRYLMNSRYVFMTTIIPGNEL